MKLIRKGASARHEESENRPAQQIVEKVVYRKSFMNPQEVREEIARRLDRLMDIYHRKNSKYLKPFLFLTWRLMVAIQALIASHKKVKAELEAEYLPVYL